MNSQSGTPYFKSIVFMFKLVEALCCLLAFICSNVLDPHWLYGPIVFLNLALLLGFVLVVVDIVLSRTGKTSNYQEYHKKYDIIFCLTISIILSSVVSYILTLHTLAPFNIPSLTAVIVFTYFAVVLFAFNAIFKVVRYEHY